MRTVFTGKVTAYFPTREDVQAIEIGSMAPSCFGDLHEVVEVTAKREDIHGKLFCCYYTEFGPTSRISNSVKEDELLRDVSTVRAHISVELDRIEENAQKAA
jgi:hypothetical protein